jgi:hypothetical protein
MTIYYTLYEAIPLSESEEFEVCGGAYISCWLKAQSEEEAAKLVAFSRLSRSSEPSRRE